VHRHQGRRARRAEHLGGEPVEIAERVESKGLHDQHTSTTVRGEISPTRIFDLWASGAWGSAHAPVRGGISDADWVVAAIRAATAAGDGGSGPGPARPS